MIGRNLRACVRACASVGGLDEDNLGGRCAGLGEIITRCARFLLNLEEYYFDTLPILPVNVSHFYT